MTLTVVLEVENQDEDGTGAEIKSVKSKINEIKREISIMEEKLGEAKRNVGISEELTRKIQEKVRSSMVCEVRSW